jgi:tripartite-type tricarboxylate transporter receptor subunit TctC
MKIKLLLLLFVFGLAKAEVYPNPNKPIKVIVPFAVGGPADYIARVITQKMSNPVIIQNITGANGIIAEEIVSNSNPDGHTILLSGVPMVTNPIFNPKNAVPLNKFIPITMLVRGYGFVLVTKPSLPVNTTKDLIRYIKENPGKLNYGTAGLGNPTHIAGELFSSDMTAIHYKGTTPVISDLLSGQLDLAFLTTQNLLPLIETGKLKAISITGPTRWKLLPNLPTISESGINDYNVINWFGIFVPEKTPSIIVDKIQKEVYNILQEDDVKKQFDEAGFIIVGSKPEEFNKFLDSETIKMKKVYNKIVNLTDNK